MLKIIAYFSTIPDEVRSFILFGGMLFFLLLEFLIPLYRMDYNKWKHAGINLTFTLITLIINLFGAVLIAQTIDFTESHRFGLLYLSAMPVWIYVLGGLLLLDLIGAWSIHWLEHRVRWLWKFHLIHHTDPNVDVTSGLRHHPGENIFRLLFTTLAVLFTGASFGLVMMYQTLSAFFAHLTHANIKMPFFIDKVFSLIFVTPHFHKIHHHYILPQTDTNYGNIFSVWDHVFRTSTTVENMNVIRYGIDTHLNPEENSNIKNLLLIPFQTYRTPSGAKFTAQ